MKNIVVNGHTYRPLHKSNRPLFMPVAVVFTKHFGKPAIWKDGWLYLLVK